jgi:hypothetical protein
VAQCGTCGWQRVVADGCAADSGAAAVTGWEIVFFFGALGCLVGVAVLYRLRRDVVVSWTQPGVLGELSWWGAALGLLLVVMVPGWGSLPGLLAWESVCLLAQLYHLKAGTPPEKGEPVRPRRLRTDEPGLSRAKAWLRRLK